MYFVLSSRMRKSNDFFLFPMTVIFKWLIKHFWLFLLAVSIFLGAMGISTVYRGAKPPYRTDFSVFKRAAQAVVEKTDIYDAKTERHWNYVYMPLLALLAVPYHFLPLSVGVASWYLISVILLCFTFLIAIRLAREYETGFQAACLAAFLTIPPFLNTLTRGQLGIISLFLAIWVFYLYRERKDFWAGFVLAFAVVLKSSPLAVLGFFFLLKREWRVIAGGITGTLFFALILPGILLGFERNWYFLQEYHRIITHAIGDLGHQGMLWQQLVTPFAEDNQSLYAVLTRLSWSSEASFVAASDNSTIRLLTRVLLYAALILLTVIGFKKKTDRRNSFLLLEYSLYPMLMILLSPVTQPHHYTVLFLFFAGGYLHIRNINLSRGMYLITEVALLIAAFSFLFGLSFDELNYWGLSVWGSIICWLWLYFLAYKTKNL